MRDLPGFYWDEERQRYFALAQENVARDLSRYDLQRVSGHDEPRPCRANAIFLSDANNQMASTVPRRGRTHLGANAPENRRRSGRKGSSSRARDPSSDGGRRKKKRGGERAGERGSDASSSRDHPPDRNPTDDARQKRKVRSNEMKHSHASTFDALRARALGMALIDTTRKSGRRVSSPSDIVDAATRAHVGGLTLAGEIRADAFGHGFELACEPLLVGHTLEWDTHISLNAETRTFCTPDRILLAGAPHADASGDAFSYVKRLRSVDRAKKSWGYAETAVCERRERACVHDAFATRALASSYMARETQRMRAVEWSAARNAGLARVMGHDDDAPPPVLSAPQHGTDSDSDAEEDFDFATQHGATPHACLSTSLMGDGANRDPARPPGGCAAISLPPPPRGESGRLAPAYRGESPAAHFFAAGDAPGRFREFKNTHPGFFDAAVSPRTGAVACVAESHGLLLYDVRANRAVNRVERPVVSVAMRGDAVAVACDVGPHADASSTPGARAELFAVGLRDGTLAFVDSRVNRPSYVSARNDSLKAGTTGRGGSGFSFVTDLVALRNKPGTLVAAAADGGLAVWDARHTRAPARVLARGTPSRVFDTRRRCSVDANERFVAFDQTHHVRAVAGRPSTAREVEALAVWDLESGKEVWRRERVAAPGASAEVASAVAVETEPGVRVWAGTRERLRLYVPKQALGPEGNASLGFWG